MKEVKQSKISYWDNYLSEAESIILRCFFPEGEEMTIKQFQEKSRYSYERVYSSLKELIKKNTVSEKRIGKTLVYSLDFNNPYSKLAFNHYSTERLIEFSKRHLIINKAISELEEEPIEIMFIFGSYSKGIETKSSDIDLMIVSDNKSEIEKAVHGLKYQYGLDIALVFVKRSEFHKIKIENPELWQDIKKNALLFKGVDIFYYWMYKK